MPTARPSTATAEEYNEVSTLYFSAAHSILTGEQDAATALELYTAGSAYAGFQEKELGRIEPGFLADLTVLDGNPVTGKPEDLLKMKARMTIVNGRIVHDDL